MKTMDMQNIGGVKGGCGGELGLARYQGEFNSSQPIQSC